MSAVAVMAALALALSPAAVASSAEAEARPSPAAEGLDTALEGVVGHPAAALPEPWRTVVGATWDADLTDRWLAALGAGRSVDDEPDTDLLREVAARSLVILAGGTDDLVVPGPRASVGTVGTVEVIDPDGVLASLRERLVERGVGVVEDGRPAGARRTVLVLGPDAARAATDVHPGTTPPVRELGADHAEVLAEVAAERPDAVVVLVDDGQLRTPWRDDVGAVLQAWSALDADATADAVADVLTGLGVPDGRLPVAMPAGEPALAQGAGLGSLADAVAYEGVSFTPADVPAAADGSREGVVTVRVRNDTDVTVSEVVQAYATVPGAGGEPVLPVLVGWTTVTLAPGARTEIPLLVHLPASTPRGVSAESSGTDGHLAEPATWTIAVGRAADDLPLAIELSRDPGTAGPGGTPVPDHPDDAPDPVATVDDDGTGPRSGHAAPEGFHTDRPSAPGPTTRHPADPTPPGPSGPSSIDLRATVPTPSTSPPGTPGLTLSVAPGGARLAAAQDPTAAGPIVLSGTLPEVVVRDARPHAVGWSVSARTEDLTAPGATIPASALGWTPRAVSGHDRLQLGPRVVGDHDGGPGLAEAALLATARGPARKGATTLRADLDLVVARETPPGSYAGTVTVTLFPVD